MHWRIGALCVAGRLMRMRTKATGYVSTAVSGQEGEEYEAIGSYIATRS